MNQTRKALVLGTFLLALGIVGCSKGSDVGETVPGPPRDLVEKSFKPPANNSATAPKSGTQGQ